MTDIEIVDIAKDSDTQVIIGHAGFIKTAEDLYETMVSSVPGIKFGMAFAEASGPCLIRSEGNDPVLKKQAEENMMKIAAGHAFIIMMRNAYPINVVNSIKAVPEVARILCATANPVQVVIAKTGQGRAIIGIVDGSASKGVETDDDRAKRKKFLRDIGYKM
jgi:uncharacterized protein